MLLPSVREELASQVGLTVISCGLPQSLQGKNRDRKPNSSGRNDFFLKNHFQFIIYHPSYNSKLHSRGGQT